MYILRCMIGLLQMFSVGGLILQRGSVGEDKGEFILSCVFVVFYIVALTIAFYAYREYKGITMGSGGAMGAMGGMGGMGGGNQNPSGSANGDDNNDDYQRIPRKLLNLDSIK